MIIWETIQKILDHFTTGAFNSLHILFKLHIIVRILFNNGFRGVLIRRNQNLYLIISGMVFSSDLINLVSIILIMLITDSDLLDHRKHQQHRLTGFHNLTDWEHWKKPLLSLSRGWYLACVNRPSMQLMKIDISVECLYITHVIINWSLVSRENFDWSFWLMWPRLFC